MVRHWFASTMPAAAWTRVSVEPEIHKSIRPWLAGGLFKLVNEPFTNFVTRLAMFTKGTPGIWYQNQANKLQ